MQPLERTMYVDLERASHVFLSKNQNYCRTVYNSPNCYLKGEKLKMETGNIYIYVLFFQRICLKCLKNYQKRFKHNLLTVVISGELDWKGRLVEGGNMFLILCSLFEIFAGSIINFITKIREKQNKMQKR